MSFPILKVCDFTQNLAEILTSSPLSVPKYSWNFAAILKQLATKNSKFSMVTTPFREKAKSYVCGVLSLRWKQKLTAKPARYQGRKRQLRLILASQSTLQNRARVREEGCVHIWWCSHLLNYVHTASGGVRQHLVTGHVYVTVRLAWQEQLKYLYTQRTVIILSKPLALLQLQIESLESPKLDIYLEVPQMISSFLTSPLDLASS